MNHALKKIVCNNRELLVYCIIGCTGAGLDFFIYAGLTCCGLFYQTANFISVSFGILNNFFWNCFFNFKTKDKWWIRLMSFYAIGMAGWMLSALCLLLLIERFVCNTILAKLGTIVIVTVIQFTLNKFITFRHFK